MRKSALLVRILVLAVVVLASMVFSQRTCLAGEFNYEQTKKDVEGTLLDMEESFGRSFKNTDLTNEELVKYGIEHAGFSPYIQGKRVPTFPDGSYLIPKQYVEAAVRKCFGLLVPVRHESVGEYQYGKYIKGSYKVPANTGYSEEEWNVITIQNVTPMGIHTVNVYAISCDTSGKKEFDEYGTFRWVKDKNGEERWIILEYKIFPAKNQR